MDIQLKINLALYLINFSGQPATKILNRCWEKELYLINFSGQPATHSREWVIRLLLYLINFSGQPATFPVYNWSR